MSRFVIPFLLLMALLAMKMSVPYLGECMLLLVSGWLVFANWQEKNRLDVDVDVDISSEGAAELATLTKMSAEAQALRKAWPEIGQQPTAEEMEGKTLEVDARDVTPRTTTEALPLVASEETLQAITDLLTSLNKDWEQDFLPLCSNIFKRDIFQASQLTEEEAQKGFSFLQKKAQVAA